MHDRVRVLFALLFCASLTLSLRAQDGGEVLTDSLPPLADSLYIYGTALATGAALPLFDAPATALPLSLDEAVRLALDNNPGVAISTLEAQRAANDATPGNAGYLPTLNANSRVIGSRSGAVTGGVNNQNVRASTGYSADVTLGYTLFDAGRGATLARLRAERRRFALLAEADAEALAYVVAQTYLDAARLQQLVVSHARAVQISQDRLRIEQSEVEIGTSAEIDAALALADLNADRANLLRQRLALAQARAALGGLLALDDPAALVITDTLALDTPPDVALLTAIISTGNRHVQALRAALDAAERAIREVRAEYLPVVGASAGVGVLGATDGLFPQALPTSGADLRYGLTATLPIFDGGNRRRRLENAQIRARQAELDIADVHASLRADASQLATAIEGYRALAALEVQNEAIARQNVRVALAQLRLGFITPIDLRQVQLTLLDAEARRIEAVYQASRAEFELRLLAGQLLPE